MVLARLLAEPMAARGAGHLVFVSSLSGKAASPQSALYTATKFGLRGFSLGAAAGPAPHGVGVSCVSPASSATPACSPTRAPLPPRRRHEHAGGRSRAAIIRAIERNRAEVDVAPLALRAGARLAGVARRARRAVQKRLGATAIARAVADGPAPTSASAAPRQPGLRGRDRRGVTLTVDADGPRCPAVDRRPRCG